MPYIIEIGHKITLVLSDSASQFAGAGTDPETSIVELEVESAFPDLHLQRLTPARLVSFIVWLDCACQGCPD
jgi:hypothetical protein